jgi:DNA topoisomerase-1
MAKPLVIVESPAKAKTLSRFLGDKYRVEASFGHVRDLPEKASEVPKEIKDKPWGRMAVDVEGDFKPYYVIPADKKRHIQSLKEALKDASEVLLATDPDREGESISSHLKEVLKPKVPTRRIVFHEITEEAVREALATAHELDEHLVKAQEGRRILDRLYGYTLSPVLWKKVQTGLSAGRVQSVAVRLIVEREEERRAFRKAGYWDLEARIAGEGREFAATLVRVGSQRLATGKDFDATTGRLKEDNVRLLSEADARTLATDLRGRLPWSVTDVEERPVTQRPSPPFTTSTLQQEANRKLGFSADRTMRAAQGLHDEGLISYHRTDSTTLSQKALSEAGRVIGEIFGSEFHTGPRQYQTKVRNAQEAHEAIRPTDFRRKPQDLGGLDADEARIYELVWKRAIASQMADARLLRTTVEITARGADGAMSIFSATGKAIQFPGYLRAYVEGSDDPAAALDDQETILPKLTRGQPVNGSGERAAGGVVLMGLEPKGHETTPPARYTDASLVKRLEDEGIGRPSTYASIISTILRRGYVFRQGKALVPSFTAFAVTQLLRNHFADYIDLGFTAEMEEDLDQVAEGQRGSYDFIREFYRGSKERPGLESRVQNDDRISYPAVDLGIDEESGLPLRVRIGRYGPFVQRGEGGAGNTASLPDDVAPADFAVDQAVELLKAKAEGPRVLGKDDATGQTVYLMSGRFGAYVQLGETPEKSVKAPKPKRASLPANQTEATITLDAALRLLDLPREVGRHPDDDQPIVANFGRFGPYIKHGDEFRSLDSDDEVFEVTLDRAVELLRQPKRSRRQKAARTVLHQLGAHPGSGAAVQLLAGRYGPYVTDGKTNASLPKTADPAKFTLEEAVALLKAREEAGPSKRPMRKRAAGGARRKAS